MIIICHPRALVFSKSNKDKNSFKNVKDKDYEIDEIDEFTTNHPHYTRIIKPDYG